MLDVEYANSVLRLTVNRPEVRNAFNDELIVQLTTAFVHLASDVRVVVLTGAGDTFCAGGDLQWMRRAASYSVDQNAEDALRLARLFEAIAEARPVVIARINGACFGGGCGLVAASDVAIASADAKFAFSEVRLGLLPATISPFVIPKIGAGHARHLFSTGERFDAAHALRIGLVHDIVESDEELDGAVDRRVRAVLSAAPAAVATAKRLAQSPVLRLEEAAALLAQTRAGEEAREGIAAFLEKRRATFRAD